MARQLVRKENESVAMFHARQVEARQDAANRMRESRANKLVTIGDSIMHIYRLMILLHESALNPKQEKGKPTIQPSEPKDVHFNGFTLSTSHVMAITKYEDRLAEISRLIRTPKQSQVVTDLLSAQLLGFRPVSSRVPTLIDSSIERVRLDAINPQRYHNPVRSGLSGRLAWDIIGATIAPQHGAVTDTPRYWYVTLPYQTIKRIAPWTMDYPVTARYSTQVMSLGQLWESDHGYFAPITIVTLDRSSHIGVRCDGRAHTGMERFIATGYVGAHAKLDRFSAPAIGYRQSSDCLHYFGVASMRDELDRKRAYSMTPLQSPINPMPDATVPYMVQTVVCDPYAVRLEWRQGIYPTRNRQGVPVMVRRYKGLTTFAHERGGLHVKAIGA